MPGKLGKVLIPFLLLGVLISPSIGQWMHLIEAHHHERQCTQEKVHFHAKEIACELTATFTTPHTLIATKAPCLLNENPIAQKTAGIVPVYFFQKIYLFHLRGPPV